MKSEVYVLDTDVLSLWQRAREPLSTRLRGLPPGKRCITLVSVIEQLAGRHQQVITAATGSELLLAQEKLYRTRRWLERLPVLDFDERAAETFEGFVGGKLGKLGRKDLLIAAIVLSRNHVLLTRNIRDFQRVPGLRIADWSR